VTSRRRHVPAFDDVITFAATRYASIQMVPFGAFVDVQTFPLLFLFPLAGLLTVFVCARKWHTCFHEPRLRLCSAFGVAGFAGCFPRPDIAHITFVAPLVLPLLAYCIRRLTQFWIPAFRYAAAGVLIGVCVPAVVSFAGTVQEALRAE